MVVFFPRRTTFLHGLHNYCFYCASQFYCVLTNQKRLETATKVNKRFVSITHNRNYALILSPKSLLLFFQLLILYFHLLLVMKHEKSENMRDYTVPLRNKRTIECVLNALTIRSKRVCALLPTRLKTCYSASTLDFVIHFVTSRFLFFCALC